MQSERNKKHTQKAERTQKCSSSERPMSQWSVYLLTFWKTIIAWFICKIVCICYSILVVLLLSRCISKIIDQSQNKYGIHVRTHTHTHTPQQNMYIVHIYCIELLFPTTVRSRFFSSVDSSMLQPIEMNSTKSKSKSFIRIHFDSNYWDSDLRFNSYLFFIFGGHFATLTSIYAHLFIIIFFPA